MIFLSFFWRYISFFRYYFIILIYNCFWIILLWNFWNFCDFLIFLCYTMLSQFINDFLSFSWRYISFFKYFVIMLICLFVTVSELFCCGFFETPVILLAILSTVNAVFWITLFEEVLSTFVADLLAWSRNFWRYLQLKLYLYFY